VYATDAWAESNFTGSAASLPHTGSIAARALRLPPQLHVTRVTVDEMARASHFPTPSSVLAVGKIARQPLPAGALARGLTLALDRVVLSHDCADVFHQKVINASMGSFARVPAHITDLALALSDLAKTSPATTILGCVLDGEDVHALPSLRDAVVVIGSEGRGLSPNVAALLTRRVTIPGYGGAESLNAAIAGAIVCDNLRRALPRQPAARV